MKELRELLLSQLEFLLRLLLACVCGAAIGYERKNRSKEAGVRTHLIVCLGAALVMIVSKYGFFDLFHQYGISQDPARVAAQIVSGISFLGAGVIFTRNTGVSGLTTAAGIWATAAVGMSIGAGLYIVAVSTAILVLLTQFAFHRNTKWMKPPVTGKLSVLLPPGEEGVKILKEKLKKHNVEILNMKGQKGEEGLWEFSLRVRFGNDYETFDCTKLLSEPEILKVEV